MHKLLVSYAKEKLEKQGFTVLPRCNLIDGSQIDLFAFKGKQNTGVECLIVAQERFINHLIGKYKKKLRRLIFCIPSHIKFPNVPNEVWRVDFSLDIIKKK